MNQLSEIPFENVKEGRKLIMTNRKNYGNYYSTCVVKYISDNFIKYYLNDFVMKVTPIQQFKDEYMILEIVPKFKSF